MSEPPLPLAPEQRIKALEKQLELANQKAQFFEAVVDALKNDYGVAIVKSDTASPRGHRLLVFPKRAYHKTTNSFHRFRRHPNLLKPGPKQIVPSAPEHVWVANITYLPAKNGPLYGPTVSWYTTLTAASNIALRIISGYTRSTALSAR